MCPKLSKRAHINMGTKFKKMNRETLCLSETTEQMDIADLSRTLNPNTSKYTFLPGVHETLKRITYWNKTVASN